MPLYVLMSPWIKAKDPNKRKTFVSLFKRYHVRHPLARRWDIVQLAVLLVVVRL